MTRLFSVLIVLPVGVKNHMSFMAFILSVVIGVLVFDYLVWTRRHRQHLVTSFHVEKTCADLLALKDIPLPSRSCVLPYAVCELMSADMFLISVAVWSTLQHAWSAMTLMDVVGKAGRVLMRRLWDQVYTGVVPRTG
ncbi:hypothetical protein DFH94DRAFT_790394 [Russula ochroleuca]|jgi:hypothetical protein|uniref:Uncharacterized protein n=1 Tax=Russula ochroleuca TaxID=152965 RepID=A0A9P5MM09_9AGAM|nr:hypothetical protein DFH94DRAFT_790394 [Russula ochroleuca]